MKQLKSCISQTYTDWLLFRIRSWQKICDVCMWITARAGLGSHLAVLRILSHFLASERNSVSHNVFPSPGVTKQVLPAATQGSALAPSNFKAVARRDSIFGGKRVNCLHEKPWSFHHCKSELSSSPDHSAAECKLGVGCSVSQTELWPAQELSDLAVPGTLGASWCYFYQY